MQSEVRESNRAALLRACRFPSAANRRLSQPSERALSMVAKQRREKEKEKEKGGKEEFVGQSFRELALLVVVLLLVRRLAGYAFPASVTRDAHLRHAARRWQCRCVSCIKRRSTIGAVARSEPSRAERFTRSVLIQPVALKCNPSRG